MQVCSFHFPFSIYFSFFLLLVPAFRVLVMYAHAIILFDSSFSHLSSIFADLVDIAKFSLVDDRSGPATLPPPTLPPLPLTVLPDGHVHPEIHIESFMSLAFFFEDFLIQCQGYIGRGCFPFLPLSVFLPA